MKQQNYSNHKQLVPGFHIVTSVLIVLILCFSVISLIHVLHQDAWMRGGVIPVLTSITLLLLFWYIRSFSTTVQDRAIRAEEALRHYILTGKPMDARLTKGQIIALRFAGDDEVVALTQRAIAEGMKPDDIKKAIKNWRADNDRC
jgi:hypothetical protein